MQCFSRMAAWAALAMAVLVPAAHPVERVPAPKAWVGATLIDPAGPGVIPRAAVIVQGERILAAGPADSTPVPPGAHRVDLAARYLIPGLINSHVHLATGPPDPRLARAYLRREFYSGITAVRDMADDTRLLGELAREISAREIVAPDLYYPALMASPEFFADPRTHDASRGFAPGTAPWMRAVTPDSDLRQIIAEARGTGAIAIKIYAGLTGDLVSKLTAEAHRQGLLVWSHATVFPAGPADVANAGVDVMSHATLLAYQVARRIPPLAEHDPLDAAADLQAPSMQAVFHTMRERGIVLDATVDTYFHSLATRYPPEVALAATRAAHAAGVRISAGTDDDADWRDPDSALFAELERLVGQVGLSPQEALASATTVGARTLGHQDEMGRLGPGFLANFVVLRRDPLQDIRNLRSVELVVSHGRPHPRRAYRPFHP